MKRVLVLLSTYNGQEYLGEQLESILTQKVEHLDILIRDDGSTDNTIAIIKEYMIKNENIFFYTGENLKSCRSFFDLISKASDNYDYYAFADQDDYWLPDKLSKAIEKLDTVKEGKVALYCSNVITTDENLDPIKTVCSKKEIKINFKNAVFENIVIGCSCVINNELFLLIKQHIPDRCYMHDWWCYIVASYYGEVIYDYNSYILYRQHTGNVLGTPRNILCQYLRRIKQSKQLCHIPSMHMKVFFDTYEIKHHKDFIINVIQAEKEMKARIYLIRKNTFIRTRRLDTIMYKIRVLLCGC